MHPLILFTLLIIIAILAYLPIRSDKILRLIGLIGSFVVLVYAWIMSVPAFTSQPLLWSGNWWYLDSFAALFLMVVSFLYFSASIVSYRYIGHEFHDQIINIKQVRLYLFSLPLFILSMLITLLANNVGVLWVALEATTLTTTFLVAFYVKDASIEAAWKYIIICSTGIALGLLGILMFAFAGTSTGVLSSMDAFHLDQLRLHAATFLPETVRWAFVFVFVGIGTKVGFVPMHAWLPDAHSKTPSPISGVLSGVLLNVALYTILRFKILADLSLDNSWWTERFFLTFGILSIVLPTFMIFLQRNYKRMLAYSSIEHMGLASFAIGLGPFGMVPALMHLVGHSIAKSMLFFGSGEIFLRYKSTKIEHVFEMIKRAPKTSVLFLFGLLGLVAVPPSVLFASEYYLIGYGLQTQLLLTLLVLVCLTIICVSMIRHTFTMYFQQTTPESIHLDETGEQWNMTHAVMVGHLMLLLLIGVTFLTEPGIQFMFEIAQTISVNL